MVDSEILDRWLDEWEGIDPDDGQYVKKRRRGIGYLNQVNAYVHNFRDWEWKYADDTLQVAATENLAGLPEDFGGRDQYFTVYYQGVEDPMTYVSPPVLRNMREANSQETMVYSIWNRVFQIPYTAAANVDYRCFYRRRPLHLDDSGITLLIPDMYEDTVILSGLVALGQQAKLDDRDGFGGQFQAGLAQMAANENPIVNGQMLAPRYPIWR